MTENALELSPISARAIEAAGLGDIRDKVLAGVRLSMEDGVRLYHTGEIAVLGALANLDRERRWGDLTLRIGKMNPASPHPRTCPSPPSSAASGLAESGYVADGPKIPGAAPRGTRLLPRSRVFTPSGRRPRGRVQGVPWRGGARRGYVAWPAGSPPRSAA